MRQQAYERAPDGLEEVASSTDIRSAGLASVVPQSPPREAVQLRRWLPACIVVPSLLLALLVATAKWGTHTAQQSRGRHRPLRALSSGAGDPTKDCTNLERGILYWTSRPLGDLKDVPSAQQCRAECESRFFCRAWSWKEENSGAGKTSGNICYLRGLKQGETPRTLSASGVVSGLRCSADEEDEADSSEAAQSPPSAGEQEKGKPSGEDVPETSPRRWKAGTLKSGKPYWWRAWPDGRPQIRLDPPSNKEDPSEPDREPQCGSIEEDIDYIHLLPLDELYDVFHPGLCLQRCEESPKCTAWSWGKSGHDKFHHCWLKELAWVKASEVRRPDDTIVSGIPCHSLQNHGDTHPAGSALLCWSLIVPRSYEVGLLGMQFNESLSIFGCEKFAVYSNESFVVVPGLQTRAANTTLSCESGGEFGTALNTDIFLKVWEKLIDDGDYLTVDWTVKADADAVFFSERLRQVVSDHFLGDDVPIYLNNCWRGLHGPIEVLSTSAVTQWGRRWQECVDHFEKVCSGPCGWGEDMFMDQCLMKVLNLRRDSAYELLVEDHCDPPNDEAWKSCYDQTHVSYHPFKTESDWHSCYVNAAASHSDSKPRARLS